MDRGHRASVDVCLYLPNPSGFETGQLYVTGWAFAADSALPRLPRIEVRFRGHRLEAVDCDVERQDVVQAFAGAPCNAGFEAYVPVWGPVWESRRVTVHAIWPDGSDDFLAEQQVFGVDGILEHARLAASLTPLRRRKLANLW